MARPGQRIGKWVLIDVLDEGGNAVVWRARNENGDVAVKVLKTRKRTSERYQRFRDEIALLRSLGPRPGILPIIDSRLPEAPSSDDPAWLAMPIAKNIAEALGHAPPLEQVVAAVADIADVLADLAADGVYHRDIKPENLYYHEGRYVVGDFGLAEFPGKEGVTERGRVIGARNFIAPEVLMTPDRVNWPPVDVYAMAKTLWVLATGYPVPLPGELRIESEQARIRSYVRQPRAHLLEGLLERATSNDPARRPSIAQVGKELRAWLKPPDSPREPADIRDLSARARAVTEPDRRAEELRGKRIRQALDALKRLAAGLDPVSAAIRDSGLGDGMIGNDAFVPEHHRPDPGEFRRWEHVEGARILTSAAPGSLVSLLSGVGIVLLPDGLLYLVAGYFLGDGRRGGPYEDLWAEGRVVPLGSALEERAIAELSERLTANLHDAVQVYTERLEEP